MSKEVLDEDLPGLVTSKVRDGEKLLLQVQCQHASVEGRKKLERRIRSEMKFLLKVKCEYYLKIFLLNKLLQ